MMDRSVRLARQSCLASNAAWRREAQNLRALSVRSGLSEDSAMRLSREAEAADRQADWWLTATIEAR
jgi:hypothetical protein